MGTTPLFFLFEIMDRYIGSMKHVIKLVWPNIVALQLIIVELNGRVVYAITKARVADYKKTLFLVSTLLLISFSYIFYSFLSNSTSFNEFLMTKFELNFMFLSSIISFSW